MTEQPYFDDSGEPSDARGRFIRPAEDVAPLELIPGLRFQPVTTDAVMTNFVTFSRAPKPRTTTTPSSRSRSSSPAS